jgi:hypothetical protein
MGPKSVFTHPDSPERDITVTGFMPAPCIVVSELSAFAGRDRTIASPLNSGRRFVKAPFEFVQEFTKFPMPDIFVGNLREVGESALNSCSHTADDGTRYSEERERARKRSCGQQWTQAASGGSKAR